MTTADAPHENAVPGEGPPRLSPPQVRPSSPALDFGWILRTAALVAGAAGILGVIVAPGVHGNAGEAVVTALDRVSATLAYLMVGLLSVLLVRGALTLLRVGSAIGTPARVALIAGPAAVIALSVPSFSGRLPPPYSVLIAAAAAVAALTAAYVSARAPHTRAVSVMLFMLVFAAIARLAAWEIAVRAGDAASVRMFGMSRGFATAGVLFEVAGQLVAAMWLSARGRGAGPWLAAALLGALVLTWGAQRGVHSGAALWQAVLHTALADAPGVPPPYSFDTLATFLVPSSLLLAIACVVQRQGRAEAAVIAVMALALVSRGAFDAPLRALCAVVAAQWVALASVDERGMWSVLLSGRERRTAGAGGGRAEAPPS